MFVFFNCRFDNPASAATYPTRQLSYHYLISLNTWLLLFPCDLCCDWTMGSVPLISSFYDPRNISIVIMYLTFIALAQAAFNCNNKQKEVIIIMVIMSIFIFTIQPFYNL